jgi:hypothetical protein
MLRPAERVAAVERVRRTRENYLAACRTFDTMSEVGSERSQIVRAAFEALNAGRAYIAARDALEEG